MARRQTSSFAKWRSAPVHGKEKCDCSAMCGLRTSYAPSARFWRSGISAPAVTTAGTGHSSALNSAVIAGARVRLQSSPVKFQPIHKRPDTALMEAPREWV